LASVSKLQTAPAAPDLTPEDRPVLLAAHPRRDHRPARPEGIREQIHAADDHSCRDRGRQLVPPEHLRAGLYGRRLQQRDDRAADGHQDRRQHRQQHLNRSDQDRHDAQRAGQRRRRQDDHQREGPAGKSRARPRGPGGAEPASPEQSKMPQPTRHIPAGTARRAGLPRGSRSASSLPLQAWLESTSPATPNAISEAPVRRFHPTDSFRNSPPTNVLIRIPMFLPAVMCVTFPNRKAARIRP